MLLEIELFKIYNNNNNNNNNNGNDNYHHYYHYYYFNFYNKEVFLKKKLELKVWVLKSVDPQLSNTPKLLPPTGVCEGGG